MSVWEPWDANEGELSSLRVVRERIPDTMRPALLDWTYKQLHHSYGATSSAAINALQSSLRINLGFDRGDVDTNILVNSLEASGDKTLLRVVDWIIGQFERDPSHEIPKEIAEIEWHLDVAMSGVRVASNNRGFRLALRLPDGVEEAAQIAVHASPKIAGQHLAKALHQIQSLDPDTSAAMTEAIRAVESAAGPIVLPKDKRLQLSKIVQSLKDKPNWTLNLQRRDDGYPDHHAVLIGMMETLVFAQQDRHAGVAPTVKEAMAHAMLAATLVGWFATGAVGMNET